MKKKLLNRYSQSIYCRNRMNCFTQFWCKYIGRCVGWYIGRWLRHDWSIAEMNRIHRRRCTSRGRRPIITEKKRCKLQVANWSTHYDAPFQLKWQISTHSFKSRRTTDKSFFAFLHSWRKKSFCKLQCHRFDEKITLIFRIALHWPKQI